MSGFAAEGTKASSSVPYYIPNTGAAVVVPGLIVDGNVTITDGNLTFLGETGGLDMGERPATLSGANTISGLTSVTSDMTFNDAANLKICYPGDLQLATSIGSVAGTIGLPEDNTNVMSVNAVGGLLLEAATGSIEMKVTGGQEVAAIVDNVNSAFRVGSDDSDATANNIRIVPFAIDGAFNGATQLDDQAIIYGENVPERTGLVIAPWSEDAPPSGIRLDAAGDLTVLGNLSLASAAASAGLFTAAAVEVEGSFVLGNVRIVYGRTNNTNGSGDTAYVFTTPFAAGTIPYVVASVFGASDLTSEISGASDTGFTLHLGTLGATGAAGVSGFFFAVGQVA